MEVYMKKALEVNDQLNCITDPIFEAEALAVELDLRQPNQRGPLHGVPVSIKDSLFLEGYDCNAGMTYFVDKLAEKDADIVKLLKSLGAVPFVRTNLSQGLMTYACSNPIYGQTSNPHNVLRGPGGSSGGEGALIRGGGSLIGIGSDIGGSIRIPCQMCGVYGLKPTVERILNHGHMPLASGQTLVRVTVGPMARDMDSLIALSEELLSPRMHKLDPAVPPLSFRDELFEKKGPLHVGYYTSFGVVGMHPACVRAVQEAKAALEQKGYKVVQFQPPRAFEAFYEMFTKALFGDDGEEDRKYLKDDVLDDCVKFSYYMKNVPRHVRYIMAKLIGLVDPPMGKIAVATCTIPKKIMEWWALQDKIQAYKAEFLEAWTSQKLDALICPGLPFPAVTSGMEDNTFSGMVYMSLYNLVNYPAGILPVTAVTEADLTQLRDPALYPRSGAFEKFIVKDSAGSEGLPVAVQCVALPYQEEMVLRVMKDIDTGVRQ
ncbi:hypothetical protein ACOMHN_007677 [Nucella lapillus]